MSGGRACVHGYDNNYVTDVKDISLQDEVEIFGEHIAIETLATWSGINMYEMMSGINARVKRIYIEE